MLPNIDPAAREMAVSRPIDQAFLLAEEPRFLPLLRISPFWFDRDDGRSAREILQKSHVTTFAVTNYLCMNQGKGILKPIGHNMGTVDEGSKRGISVTIRSHSKTKKPTFVGKFASVMACHPVDVLPK